MLKYVLNLVKMTSTNTSDFSRSIYSKVDFSRLENILSSLKPITINPSIDLIRQDETDDEQFYSIPRFVHHIDDRARYILSQFYTYAIKQTPEIMTLDLCSSWTSHLPEDFIGKLSLIHNKRGFICFSPL